MALQTRHYHEPSLHVNVAVKIELEMSVPKLCDMAPASYSDGTVAHGKRAIIAHRKETSNLQKGKLIRHGNNFAVFGKAVSCFRVVTSADNVLEDRRQWSVDQILGEFPEEYKDA